MDAATRNEITSHIRQKGNHNVKFEIKPYIENIMSLENVHITILHFTNWFYDHVIYFYIYKVGVFCLLLSNSYISICMYKYNF